MKKIPLFLILLLVFSTLLIAGCTQQKTIIITKNTTVLTAEPTAANSVNQTLANLENKTDQAIAKLENKTNQAIASLENKSLNL
jgi:uncharacterized lipoprotein YajG